MNKYDVNLIVDKEGKPMPQYYDEVEGVMKPITKDNFDGNIKGDVKAVVDFPESQTVDGTVQVSNLPSVQKVEVTNQKEVQNVNVVNPTKSVEVSNFPLTQDVNILNPQKNVTIDNFPSVQNVTDAQVKAELEQIKATQAQILKRLNGQLITEDGAQVVTKGAYNYKMEKLVDSITIEAGGNSGPIYLNATDERDIILYVSIDKQPWTLQSSTYFGRVSAKANFPRYYDHTETYADENPAFALLLGIVPEDQRLKVPTSIEEAKDIKAPLTKTGYILIRNGSEETATVTVHVLRVWG